MFLDNPLGDGQTQSGTAFVAGTRLVTAEKAVKDVGHMIRRYADPRIADSDNHLSVVLDRRQVDTAAGRCVFEGVVKKNNKQLMQSFLIRPQCQIILFVNSETYLPHFLEGAEVVRHDIDDIPCLDGRHLQFGLVGIGSGQCQQTGDQLGHARRFLQNGADAVALLLHCVIGMAQDEFSVAVDAGDG